MADEDTEQLIDASATENHVEAPQNPGEIHRLEGHINLMSYMDEQRQIKNSNNNISNIISLCYEYLKVKDRA